MLHAGTHAPPALQVTVPFVGAVHTVQLLPHEVMLVLPLTTQVAFAPVPHSWYPVVQLTPQVYGPLPSQVAVPPTVSAAHGAQRLPQELGLLFTRQVSPQR